MAVVSLLVIIPTFAAAPVEAIVLRPPEEMIPWFMTEPEYRDNLIGIVDREADRRGDNAVHTALRIDQLATDHPDLVKLHTIGRSRLGIPIIMIEIADFAAPAAKPLDEREVIWLDAATHGNEQETETLVFAILDNLTDGYGSEAEATWIIENRHIFAVPMVNPDGSVPGTRESFLSVDLNRNYPVGWQMLPLPQGKPGPLWYGPYAASEPETQAMLGGFNATRPDYLASIHCCGTMGLYPYGIDGVQVHDDDLPVFERICDETLRGIGGTCGPIWSTIYPAPGSSIDSAYEYTGAVAFGYEINRADFVTGEALLDVQPEVWSAIRHGILNAHLFGGWPAITGAEEDGDGMTVTIVNRGWGNLTAATISTTDKDGHPVTAPVPDLAAGATATIELDAAFDADVIDGRITYTKRALTLPEHRSFSVTLK